MDRLSYPIPWPSFPGRLRSMAPSVIVPYLQHHLLKIGTTTSDLHADRPQHPELQAEISTPGGPAMRRGLTTSVRFSPVMCKPSPFPGNPQSIPLYTVSCSPPKSPYSLPDLLLGWHWPHTARFLLQLFGRRRTASGVPQANQTQKESSFSLMTHFLHLIHAGTKMECFVIVGVTAVLFGNLHWSWYGFWGLVLYKRIQKELSCLQWTVYWTVKTFEGKQQDEREKGWFIVCGLHTMHCKQ